MRAHTHTPPKKKRTRIDLESLCVTSVLDASKDKTEKLLS